MKTLLFLVLTTFASAAPILLWPGGAPGSEGNDTPEIVVTFASGELTVTNIHKPSITPYLPAKDKANGAAVIVAPGGGHAAEGCPGAPLGLLFGHPGGFEFVRFECKVGADLFDEVVCGAA